MPARISGPCYTHQGFQGTASQQPEQAENCKIGYAGWQCSARRHAGGRGAVDAMQGCCSIA
eukprot:12288548-Karenia_brevis.AAC.1